MNAAVEQARSIARYGRGGCRRISTTRPATYPACAATSTTIESTMIAPTGIAIATPATIDQHDQGEIGRDERGQRHQRLDQETEQECDDREDDHVADLTRFNRKSRTL